MSDSFPATHDAAHHPDIITPVHPTSLSSRPPPDSYAALDRSYAMLFTAAERLRAAPPGTATFADLCPADKHRVAELIRQLAAAAEEQQALQAAVEQERARRVEAERAAAACIVRLQQELDSALELLKTYQQALTDITAVQQTDQADSQRRALHDADHESEMLRLEDLDNAASEARPKISSSTPVLPSRSVARRQRVQNTDDGFT